MSIDTRRTSSGVGFDDRSGCELVLVGDQAASYVAIRDF